jgi:Chlorophyll A-B binding protein
MPWIDEDGAVKASALGSDWNRLTPVRETAVLKLFTFRNSFVEFSCIKNSNFHKSRKKAMHSGTTTDEQGKLNIFAIEPEMYVDETAQTGFTPHAELVNGRAAMLGFVALLLTEALTHQSFISLFLD